MVFLGDRKQAMALKKGEAEMRGCRRHARSGLKLAPQVCCLLPCRPKMKTLRIYIHCAFLVCSKFSVMNDFLLRTLNNY